MIPLIPLNESESTIPSAPPPPSYDEVISSGMYPEPSAPTSATVRGVSLTRVHYDPEGYIMSDEFFNCLISVSIFTWDWRKQLQKY